MWAWRGSCKSMENGERGMDDEGMKSCLLMVKQWEKRGRWV